MARNDVTRPVYNEQMRLQLYKTALPCICLSDMITGRMFASVLAGRSDDVAFSPIRR